MKEMAARRKAMLSVDDEALQRLVPVSQTKKLKIWGQNCVCFVPVRGEGCLLRLHLRLPKWGVTLP